MDNDDPLWKQQSGRHTRVDPEPTNDTDLIGRASRGDQEACRLLVQRYQGPLFAAAYAMVHNSADAADIVQDAFIRFFKNIDFFDPTRPLKPYLVKIGVNAARDFLRRQRRRAVWQSNEPLPEAIAGTDPGPDRQAARGERSHAIRKLLGGLPETMRRVCVMFYLGEATCRQIAGDLGMTETAVKVNLHRARKKLLTLGIAEWRHA